MFSIYGQTKPNTQREIHRAASGCPLIDQVTLDQHHMDTRSRDALNKREHENERQR